MLALNLNDLIPPLPQVQRVQRAAEKGSEAGVGGPRGSPWSTSWICAISWDGIAPTIMRIKGGRVFCVISGLGAKNSGETGRMELPLKFAMFLGDKSPVSP